MFNRIVLLTGLIIISVSAQIDLEKITGVDNPDDIPLIKDWKEQCEKDHGRDTLLDIEEAPGAFVGCVLQYIKIEKIKIEVNRSMNNGNLDLVFKKYCGYREQVLACVDSLLDTVKVCMPPQQMVHVNITRRALDEAIDFVCHNEGERIALFMSEEGMECVGNSTENIKTCTKNQVPELENEVENFNDFSLDTIVAEFDEKHCSKLFTMQDCVSAETGKCKDKTTQNLFDSLVDHMMKVTPCERQQEVSTAHSGAPSISYRVRNTLGGIGPIFISITLGIISVASEVSAAIVSCLTGVWTALVVALASLYQYLLYVSSSVVARSNMEIRTTLLRLLHVAQQYIHCCSGTVMVFLLAALTAAHVIL